MANVEKSVIIGGIEYPLWHDDEARKALMARGQYLGDEQKVFIDRNLPRATFLRTVLHESLHGIFERSTLCSGTETQWEVPPELQEKLCQLLERELPQLFAENTWLAEVFE